MAKTKKQEINIQSENQPEVETKSASTYNQEHFIPRNYARSHVQPLWASSNNSVGTSFTNTQIASMLKSPYSTYKQLQMVSDFLANSNSSYNNIVDYFANIIAFSYVLYPTSTTDNVTTVKNRIYSSAKIISKIHLESVFPNMLKQAIMYGESYWYDLSDNENTIIIEMPRNICVLSQIDDDNLWRYYVDLSLVNPTTLYELPEEIQEAHKKYIDSGKPKGKRKANDIMYVPEQYHEVSKKGFAIFIHGKKMAHDYPFLLHMFSDLLLLGEDKSYFNEFIKDDAVKVVHQKVPVDKETGKPIMNREVIEAYHNSSKEHVGKNISIMTNPFEVEGIAIDKNQQTALNVVEHDIKVIQNDSGISSTIFDANSTNGLGYSTKADSARMYPILYFFTNFVNYKIKQFKCQIKFLHINIFEKDDVHEQARTDLLSGGSRSLFMSTSPIDIYSYLNLVEMEKILDFDSILIPKMNASQQSGDQLDNGRPKKKEGDKADSTVVVDGYK